MDESFKSSQTQPNDDASAYAQLMARREAEKVILQHLNLCPFAQLNIEKRMRALETRFALLCGAMIGSGVIGGATASMISRLFP